MSAFAIRVENLSKSFRILHLHKQHLREALESRIRRPWTMLRRQGSTAEPPTQTEETLWALRDVSFEIGHGEVVGFIGHNGAGKSVMLKILNQVIKPTAGRAEIFGRVGSLLEVGTGFHFELTGRENIFLSAVILGMRKPEIERKFDEIVAFSGVEKFLDTPVKRYSNGMRVRLGFAVAAHLEPEILLIDEVLAVGDQSFVDSSIDKMEEMARSGRTLIFVSHQLALVEKLCNRALLFQNGRVVRDGPCAEVTRHYSTAVGYSI